MREWERKETEPLHYIYQHDKHLGIVKRLLVRGANVRAMNGLGETPY
jgi:hypothetical protein